MSNPPKLAYTLIYEDIWRHASKDYINPYIFKLSLAMNFIYYDYKVILMPEGDQQLMADLGRPNDIVSVTHLS